MAGSFNFDSSGTPAMVEGPAWSRALVLRMTPAEARRLGTGVEWAKRELQRAPESEAKVRAKLTSLAEREAPWVAQFIETALNDKTANFLAILGFIAVLLTFFGWAPVDQREQPPAPIVITDQQLEQMFREYLDRNDADDQRGSPGSPPPERIASDPPKPGR